MAIETVIRTATVEHLSEVLRLEEQWAAIGETIGFQPTSVELLRTFVGECFFVATREDVIVGFIYGQPKHNDGAMSAVFADQSWYLEIENLYIASGSRSEGIGARLIESATEWAKRNAIRYLSAYSSTRDVDRLLHFYRGCGFKSWSVQVFRDLEEAE